MYFYFVFELSIIINIFDFLLKIDEVIYQDELIDHLKKESKKKINVVPFMTYTKTNRARKFSHFDMIFSHSKITSSIGLGNHPNQTRFAFIPLCGPIHIGESSKDPFSPSIGSESAM